MIFVRFLFLLLGSYVWLLLGFGLSKLVGSVCVEIHHYIVVCEIGMHLKLQHRYSNSNLILDFSRATALSHIKYNPL